MFVRNLWQRQAVQLPQSWWVWWNRTTTSCSNLDSTLARVCQATNGRANRARSHWPPALRHLCLRQAGRHQARAFAKRFYLNFLRHQLPRAHSCSCPFSVNAVLHDQIPPKSACRPIPRYSKSCISLYWRIKALISSRELLAKPRNELTYAPPRTYSKYPLLIQL